MNSRFSLAVYSTVDSRSPTNFVPNPPAQSVQTGDSSHTFVVA